MRLTLENIKENICSQVVTMFARRKSSKYLIFRLAEEGILVGKQT